MMFSLTRFYVSFVFFLAGSEAEGAVLSVLFTIVFPVLFKAFERCTFSFEISWRVMWIRPVTLVNASFSMFRLRFGVSCFGLRRARRKAFGGAARQRFATISISGPIGSSRTRPRSSRSPSDGLPKATAYVRMRMMSAWSVNDITCDKPWPPSTRSRSTRGPRKKSMSKLRRRGISEPISQCSPEKHKTGLFPAVIAEPFVKKNVFEIYYLVQNSFNPGILQTCFR